MISVIIPVFNEASNLTTVLDLLAAETTRHEVIVVDGGSDDGSVTTAKDFQAGIVHSDRGRGVQLAAGAKQASGDILLFLHADTGFPAGGLDAIKTMLTDDPTCIGGNFRLCFDGDTQFSRRLTGFYAWIRSHGLYYGDSGIFVRRRVYDQIGGIRPFKLMEDYDFTRRMEKFGKTCCIDTPSLVTSSRKFAGRPAVGIVWGWLKIHALYHLGVSPDRLARIYYGRN